MKCTNCGHDLGLIDMIFSPNLNYHVCPECGERQKTSYFTILLFVTLVTINFILLDGVFEVIGFIFMYILFWPFLNLVFGFRK